MTRVDRLIALTLGESDTVIELEDGDACRHAIDLLTDQTRNSLEMISRDLDAPLLDRGPFLDALNRLCSRNRQARVRILVQDPAAAVRDGHRLIELGRRLSSSIEFRQPHPDYRHYNEAFLVADGCGYLHRPLADRYEGTVNFNDRVQARRYQDFFTEVWERSQPHPDLRRLYI